MIPKDFIADVVSKTDLTDLASRYTELVPGKGSNMVGLCPFNCGTNSTFVVSPDKNIWKCFKCGKGGNAISLVMDIDKLSFPEAVRFLAKRLDLEVPEQEV